MHCPPAVPLYVDQTWDNRIACVRQSQDSSMVHTARRNAAETYPEKEEANMIDVTASQASRSCDEGMLHRCNMISYYPAIVVRRLEYRLSPTILA